jgi:hypothetical protein
MRGFETIQEYLRRFSNELAERILATYPPLHKFEDPVSPRMNTLLRKPYRAQELAANGGSASLAAGASRCGHR